MSLLSYVDIYCERTASGFWNEPLNAITNAAFLIAAWMLYRHYKKRGYRDYETAALIFLIALVGTDSFLFHTFAIRLTLLADIIPITLFVFYYLSVTLRRFFNFHPVISLASAVALVMLMMSMSGVPEPYRFNGSVPYFPCLAAILLLSWPIKDTAAKKLLLLAAACFALSLTFRSIDQMLCPVLPFGTHFLWHVLNGIVLYWLTKAVLVFPRPAHN